LKRLGVLILVLVVLAAVYGVVRLRGRRSAEPVPLFPGFNPGAAAGIYIKAGGGRVALEEHDGVWTVVSEDSLPADPAGVESILEKVKSFSRGDLISSNPAKRALYQVDTSGVWVGIVGASGDTLASFVVGKVGPDYQSSYVRATGSDDVILAAGYLRSMFDRGERTWQDRLIFSFEPGEITDIRIVKDTGSYAMSRTAEGEWYLSEPDSAGVKQDLATRLVRRLAMLRCEGFAGRSPVAGSGLPDAGTVLWFRLASGEEHRLALGNKDEDGFVYAMKDDSDVVYLLMGSLVDLLAPDLSQIRTEETGPAGTAE
jgi:hypothetical protein